LPQVVKTEIDIDNPNIFVQRAEFVKFKVENLNIWDQIPMFEKWMSPQKGQTLKNQMASDKGVPRLTPEKNESKNAIKKNDKKFMEFKSANLKIIVGHPTDEIHEWFTQLYPYENLIQSLNKEESTE